MIPIRPLTIITMAMLAALWTWQWFDYRNHVHEHTEEFDRLGEAILGAAEGAVYRHCRGGHYDPEEITLTLEEIRGKVDAARIVLSSGENPMATASIADPLPAVVSYQREFLHPLHQGGGRGRRWAQVEGYQPLPDGPMHLVLELPRGGLDTKLAGDLRRLLFGGIALSLVFLLAFALFWFRIRSLRLRSRLEAAREKVDALEFLRRLGAGLAHETRNPLGVVRGFAERILGPETDPKMVREAAETIIHETDRTLARLDEFQLLSRPAALQRSLFPARPFFDELTGLLLPELEHKQATLDLTGTDFQLDADSEQARRLFLNLLLNASQAIGDGGAIRVELRVLDNRHEVAIIDDGPGVSAEIRDTLFEPYVTRRNGGTGLGLSIARRIALEHGWVVRYETGRAGGAEFVVELWDRS